MIPVAPDQRLHSVQLSQQRALRHTVHFGHPPGRYLLHVVGANSAVPGTYVFGAGLRIQSVFWSPCDLRPTGEVYAPEGSPDAEAVEDVNSEIAAAPMSPFAGLDAVIAAIRESRPLAPPAPEIARVIEQAIRLQASAPPDVDEWARQLASDVADLTD